MIYFQHLGNESDMDLDLLAESDSDSDSNHSNQDGDNASQDQDVTSGRRSAVTAATAGSDAGRIFAPLIHHKTSYQYLS